eukprot:1147109-Pelagomonas_calceolata.AAC.4
MRQQLGITALPQTVTFVKLMMMSRINNRSSFIAHIPRWSLSAGKERKIYACRSVVCIKERFSHRLPPIEGIFISTPASRIRSGDLLLAVALLALDCCSGLIVSAQLLFEADIAM